VEATNKVITGTDIGELAVVSGKSLDRLVDQNGKTMTWVWVNVLCFPPCFDTDGLSAEGHASHKNTHFTSPQRFFQE